jgi:tetratricopeptide (TPR) repeat protein
MLTGRPPFRGETPLETIRQVVEREPQRPGAVRPGVDRDLETICLKCLDKDPQRRYGSAEALAEDLESWLSHRPIRARRVGPGERLVKWARRRPATAVLLAVLAVVLTSLTAGTARYVQQRAAQEESDHLLSRQRRNDVLDLLRQAQEAESEGRLADTTAHLGGALEIIRRDPALAEFQGPAESLMARTTRRTKEQALLAEARKKHKEFFPLRDEALFHATLFTGADLPASREAARAAAEKALDRFGLATDAGPPLVPGPEFSDQQKAEITEGCYELLLVLAEAEAGPEKALTVLGRANGLGDPPLAYHLRRARYLKEAGRADEARDASRQAAALEPASAADFFLLGYDAQRRGDLATAVSHFESALDKRSDHFWARYFLAVCHLRARPARPEAAIAHLTGCLVKRDDAPRVYLLLGLAHTGRDDVAAAEADFGKALSKGPDGDARYAALVNRGVVRGRQKKWRDAEEDLRAAIEMRPQQYQAYANLARVYQDQHRPCESLAQLDEAIERGEQLFKARQIEPPALAVLYHNHGEVHWELGRLYEAEEDFDQALRVAPSAKTHAERGRLLYGQERYREAVGAFTAAMTARDFFPIAYLGRARARVELREFKEAVADLDEYLRNHPPDTAPDVLADAYVLRGLTRAEIASRAKVPDYSGAIDDYDRALRLRPNSPTHAYRGWAHLVSGELLLARADFTKAIDRSKHNWDAYNGRGLVHARLGCCDEALKDAARAALCEPQDPREKRRLLHGRAHIHAQVAAALRADPQRAAQQGLAAPAAHESDAVALLTQALDLTPPAEQAAFWRNFIERDPWLAPIRNNTGFSRLRADHAR